MVKHIYEQKHTRLNVINCVSLKSVYWHCHTMDVVAYIAKHGSNRKYAAVKCCFWWIFFSFPNILLLLLQHTTNHATVNKNRDYLSIFFVSLCISAVSNLFASLLNSLMNVGCFFVSVCFFILVRPQVDWFKCTKQQTVHGAFGLIFFYFFVLFCWIFHQKLILMQRSQI